MEERKEELAEIVNDPAFRALLRLSQQKALTWDEFLNHPLPPRTTPLSVWNLLENIGSCMGVQLFSDKELGPFWYRRTHELDDLVKAIEGRSARNSALHEAVFSRMDGTFAVGLRLSEAMASARLGGFDIDEERLEMHVRSGTPPEDPMERIVANAIRIDADLFMLAEEPFSRDLLAELRQRLLDGVGNEDLDRISARTRNDPIDEDSWKTADERLGTILDYANGARDAGDSPVLGGSLIADVVRRHRLAGAVSAQTASLAARLFYLKHHLPVLAVVPISRARQRWGEGASGSRTRCRPEQYRSTLHRARGDLTVHQTISAECIDEALKETEAEAKGLLGQDRIVRKSLAADARFNNRQRSILARALRSPVAEFHIRYHQEKHRISYATARRDFVELEEAGYLRAEQRGKGLVFLATERLGELSRTG